MASKEVGGYTPENEDGDELRVTSRNWNAYNKFIKNVDKKMTLQEATDALRVCVHLHNRLAIAFIELEQRVNAHAQYTGFDGFTETVDPYELVSLTIGAVWKRVDEGQPFKITEDNIEVVRLKIDEYVFVAPF